MTGCLLSGTEPQMHKTPGRELARKRAPAPGSRMPVLRLGCRFLLLAVLARVALHPAGGVDELLLPGEEGMAIGADLETQLLALRRPRGPSRPAGAMDVDDLVLGMDSWLHGAPRGGLCWPHKRLILPEKPSKFSPTHSTAAGRPRSKVRKCPSTSVHARRSTC